MVLFLQGTVAKSTHSGIPWLRYIRQRMGNRVHFWPFDGWEVPSGKAVLLEVYPSLWSRMFPRDDRTQDQRDAYAAAAWLKQTDREGRLEEYLTPGLDPAEQLVDTDRMD